MTAQLSHIQHRIEQLNYQLFLLLLLVMPYSFRFMIWVGAAWAGTWLLEGRWLKKPQLPAEGRKSLIFYAGIAIWILWEMISTSWSIDSACGWRIIGRHVGILLMVLPALYGVNKNYRLEEILRTIVVSCIASVGIYIFVHYWVINPEAVWEKMADNRKSIDWLGMNDLTFSIKHRLHYASYLTIGIMSAAYLTPYWLRKYGRALGGFALLATITLLCVAIYWSGSRAVLLNLMAIAATALIIHFRGWKRIVATLTAAATVAILILCLFNFHPRFSEHNLQELLQVNVEEEMPSAEPRMAEWYAMLQHPEDYTAYGIGAGGAEEYMTRQYITYGWPEFIQRRYSPHNQYLSEWLELGIVAAILFTLLFFSFPWLQKKRARHAALYFTVALCLTLMTETSLNGVEGTFNVCIGLLLVQFIGSQKGLLPSEA